MFELLVNFAFVLRETITARFDGIWPECLEEAAPPSLRRLLEEAGDFDQVDWFELAEISLTEAMIAYGTRRLSVFLPEVVKAQVVLL